MNTPEQYSSSPADSTLSVGHVHHGHQCNCKPAARPPRVTVGIIFRFFGWFVGFTGLFTMGAACPFCGQQGCPVGTASAGILGLFFASLLQWGKGLLAAVKVLLRRK